MSNINQPYRMSDSVGVLTCPRCKHNIEVYSGGTHSKELLFQSHFRETGLLEHGSYDGKSGSKIVFENELNSDLCGKSYGTACYVGPQMFDKMIKQLEALL